ncbi:hypothetical protein [Agrilutibacter solisilvae]|uniref:Uncharacterized protein n=1 Tax=Agrilutibacter solisilvae TaxID=2763317 RepID=A0A975ARM9_9GAMM|nr:hypothetical protein [Lysobacter solisilvae]QSX77125.1 hypothetical protein I8J32_009925 [Lysobacter solisilvae]
MKPFTTLTCVLLALISVLQLSRVLLAWDVVVNGVAIPLWASVLATIIPAVLSVMTWRESRR